MAVQIGDKVPEFLGTDQDGKEVKMSSALFLSER